VARASHNRRRRWTRRTEVTARESAAAGCAERAGDGLEKGALCFFFCVCLIWLEGLGDRFSWRAFSRMTKLAADDGSGINWEFRGKLQIGLLRTRRTRTRLCGNIQSMSIQLLASFQKEYEDSDIHQKLRDFVQVSMCLHLGLGMAEFPIRNPDVGISRFSDMFTASHYVDRYQNRVSRSESATTQKSYCP
jgi:hypothetical protein